MMWRRSSEIQGSASLRSVLSSTSGVGVPNPEEEEERWAMYRSRSPLPVLAVGLGIGELCHGGWRLKRSQGTDGLLVEVKHVDGRTTIGQRGVRPCVPLHHESEPGAAAQEYTREQDSPGR